MPDFCGLSANKTFDIASIHQKMIIYPEPEMIIDSAQTWKSCIYQRKQPPNHNNIIQGKLGINNVCFV